MARANKSGAGAAALWRLFVFGVLLAGGVELIRQQREIDDLQRKLESVKPAAQGLAASDDSVWTAPPKADDVRPVDLNSNADAKRRAEQHYLSGVIYFQKGDYQKARSEWTLARQDDPANEDAQAGLERLDSAPAGR